MTESSIVKDNSALHQAVYDAALRVTDLQIKLDASRARVAELERQLAALEMQLVEDARITLLAESRVATLEAALRKIEQAYPNHIRGPAGIIARNALAPPVAPAARRWTPTHRHYKGGLYRVIGCIHIEEDWDTAYTEYENEKGERIARRTALFEGYLLDGTRRFTPIEAAPQEDGT